jgi:hypothetical protein
MIGLVFLTYLNNQSTPEEAIQPENTSQTDLPTVEESETPVMTKDYSSLKEHVMSGGPPKDGIPPIDNPKYLKVSDVDYLNDLDPVFVLETKKQVYVYPQKILVWHEIVNEIIDGQNMSITYCPLTGSTICYLADEDHLDNTYGTSGSLLNSNLVMYDRKTDSLIPQILGVSIDGTLSKEPLPTRPVLWSTWERVSVLYPNALVLSTDTAYFRDYNNDPYGSYMPDDEKSYYFFGGPLFPILHEDDTFSAKKNVIGVKNNHNIVAIDPELIKANSFIEFEIGQVPSIAIYDKNLNTVRVFSRIVDQEVKSLRPSEGGLIDNNDTFYPYLSEKLRPMNHFDVMWFAWYAYYPETEVIK